MWRISYLNLSNDEVEQKGVYNNKFEEVAKAIVEGILGKEIKVNDNTVITSNNTTNNKNIYRVIEL